MKRVLLGLFVIATLSVSAQIETGKIFVGGSIGINSTGSSVENIAGGTTTETEGVSSFGFSILPQAGYMLTDQIGVGLGIGYGFNKTTTPNGVAGQYEQVDKDGSFVISPFTRYFKSVTEKFYLYVNFAVPIRTTNTSYLVLNANGDGTEDYDGTLKSSNFGVSLGLGADYFVSDNIALEANFNLFGINYYSYKKTDTNTNGDGNINKNSGFNFGFDTANVFNTGNISVGVKIFL